ncbi:TFIIB-type zinc ribbon-containing protein [Shewanella surugensis]|uniref:Zf-TFIIB domain-containing protein n=1 Tax=Shewanella surugensis TaxID=212020 RepID=A0ABT0LE30_9GAMM|nr:zf-TFIIB domain-containing protein [Shewanella surugensis]MCL1125954.1 zf-TFIIB domain-containing protein [Shewanella surugensis]
MQCPRTKTLLSRVKVGGISIDYSTRCGGVFFDHHELQHFDEKQERRGEVLVEHLQDFYNPDVDVTPRIHCPKCSDIVMARHFYSPKNQIEVDSCPGCGGIWLDYGELKKIRQLFPTQAHRVQAAENFQEVFSQSPEYRVHIEQVEHKHAIGGRLRQFNECQSLLAFLI